jgi:REP element-mobilizing transposase RayT
MKERLLEGRYYHIYNRGNNKENLFIEEANYEFFLKRYAHYCYPVLDTYAYCLLKNHFHLLVRVRSPKEMQKMLDDALIDKKVKSRLTKNEWTPKLVCQQLSHLFNGYTQALNKKYNRTGSLFERPFERINVNEDNYFCNLVSYIHRNPELHGLVDDYKQYPHSSYPIYLSEKKSRINKKETLNQFGGIDNFKAAHDEGMKIPKEYKFD